MEVGMSMNSPAPRPMTSARPRSSRGQLLREPLVVANNKQPQRTGTGTPTNVFETEAARPPAAAAPGSSRPHEYNDFFQRLRTELELRGASAVSSPPP